jgi:hypothetical protein
MNTRVQREPKSKSQTAVVSSLKLNGNGRDASYLTDNRPEVSTLSKLQELANQSQQVCQLKALQQLANNSLQVKQAAQLRALAEAKLPAPIQQNIHPSIAQLAQGPEEEELLQANSETVQHQQNKSDTKPRGNNTGLPDKLKAGIESLSGLTLDQVKVHYNSAQPAQLNALAYAQGSDIHLAPGQEQHLPHEAWHIVQQAQGRVRPTMQMNNGVLVNNDAGLEREADLMGALAPNQVDVAQKKYTGTETISDVANTNVVQRQVVQLFSPVGEETKYSVNHRFMLLNPKSLWTLQENLDHSNTILNEKNSFVKLVKTGLEFESAFGGTMHEIEPKWDSTRAATIPETQRLEKANKNVDGYITHADCFMNAQTVMGVEDTATGSLNSVAPLFVHDSKRSQIKPINKTKIQAGPTSTISGNAPTRGYLAFLEHALPAFYATLDKKLNKTDAEKDFLSKWRRETLNGFLAAYRELSGKEEYAAVLEAFSLQFGVNTHMSPDIGEGLAVINQPYERAEMQNAIENGESNPDNELWNYHFAGVVMKDDDDYVTLENYSVGNDTVDNQEWIFQMYGTGDQSFHAAMKSKKGIGKSALSLSFETSKIG